MFGTTNLRIILALVVAMPLLAAAQETYDVVINNGRVMDPETDLDGMRNIGIRGQSIVEISQSPLQGTIEIDASGLIVNRADSVEWSVDTTPDHRIDNYMI